MSSSDHLRRLQRALPSTLYAYHEFVQEILSALEELGWPKDEMFGVHMALEESISNAVRHGNKEDPAKQVHIECELSEKRFYFKVCDEVAGYDPDKVPNCCSKKRLQVSGGRGLKLIHSYMTGVELTEGGRCIAMEKVLK